MLSMILMAWGSLSHSVGAPTVKLRSPEHLFGLDEEIDRRLPCVRSLRLMREERYGGWLKCIALYVRRLYLNNIVCAGRV